MSHNFWVVIPIDDENYGEFHLDKKNKKYTDEIIVFDIDVLKINPDILFLHCSLN